MLRIFADQMESPVFGMLQAPDDETLEYPLPAEVSVVGFPKVRGRAKICNLLLNRGLPQRLCRTIDACYAVYLRQPLWECWDVFRYARAKGKKVLASYHGDWVDAIRKAEGGAVRRGCNLASSLVADHILKATARRSEVLFCVGRRLSEKYGSFAKECIVFANFLHSLADIGTPLPVRASPPYQLLYVGGFEEYKGVKYLIKAVSLLQRMGLDVELTLVGAGALEDPLRNLVRSENIQARVKFLGYVQHGKELLEVFRHADLFVLPSIASEGTPKVLMEAMSQGTPVIATNVGSVRHLLEDGRYGMVVRPGDVSALTSAIRTMLEEASLRSTYVGRGLQLARASTKERQQEIVRNGLEKMIREIVGTPPYLAACRS